jgi:hypothetical protein
MNAIFYAYYLPEMYPFKFDSQQKSLWKSHFPSWIGIPLVLEGLIVIKDVYPSGWCGD